MSSQHGLVPVPILQKTRDGATLASHTSSLPLRLSHARNAGQRRETNKRTLHGPLPLTALWNIESCRDFQYPATPNSQKGCGSDHTDILTLPGCCGSNLNPSTPESRNPGLLTTRVCTLSCCFQDGRIIWPAPRLGVMVPRLAVLCGQGSVALCSVGGLHGGCALRAIGKAAVLAPHLPLTELCHLWLPRVFQD